MIKNKSRLNRRDFLKLTAAVAGGALLSPVQSALNPRAFMGDKKPNVILLVFDAMSARHLSLYDYVYNTTPNFKRFAQQATVYHSHFSGGNFTTPGTASMLTGTYPWTHRAINHRGLIKRELMGRNIFNALGDDYFRTGFSHNLSANILLAQFASSVDERIPPASYADNFYYALMEERFRNNYVSAHYAYDGLLNPNDLETLPASLLLGVNQKAQYNAAKNNKNSDYPYGLPTTGYVDFEIRDTLAGLNKTAHENWTGGRPFFEYFHIFPPHQPYRPQKDFAALFLDAQGFIKKPRHPLVLNRYADDFSKEYNSLYDQFVTNVDYEFGLLLDSLEKSGILDSTYLIVTSDHGETFERGMIGHGSPLLYDSIIHIPLMVRAPGQAERADFFSVTSNLDLAPTILKLAGAEPPAGLEGKILPGFGGVEQSDRPVYSMQADLNSPFRPFTKASIALNQGNYKLIHYLGYPESNSEFELYDLKNDPHELVNLFGKLRDTTVDMKTELLQALENANKPYIRSNQ